MLWVGYLQGRQDGGNHNRGGDHCITGGVDLFDFKEAARIPEQVTNAVGRVIANWIGDNEFDGRQGAATQLQTLHHGHIVIDVVGGDECGQAQAPDTHAQSQASATVHDGQHGGELWLVDR